MWWTSRSAQKQQKEREKQKEQEEQEREREEEEEVEAALKLKKKDEQPDMVQVKQHNLILNHHPSINFLATTGTPVPSFPPSETPIKPKTQLNFNTTPKLIPPNHPPPTTVPTLRFVENQPSSINLPYPNPDLSFTSIHDTPTTTSKSSNQERRISGLPARAQTSFKPLPSPLRPSPATQPYQSALNELISSQSADNKENLIPSVLNQDETNSHPQVSQTINPSQKIIFPTPSAAISSIIHNPRVNPVLSSTIDQVLNELDTRTKAGPRIAPKVTFEDQKGLRSTQPTNDRFQKAHGEQFQKYDSITNHYAAKRKNNQSTTAAEEAQSSNSINQPNKRAKVSDLGYPKRVVSQQEIDASHAAKKKEIVKRQLELARARRKTATRILQTPQNVGMIKPQPSGFSSFGSRLIKSAMKTVTGVIKSTSQQISSKTITKTTDGVGFGVPAGLGVGPAKAPPSPTKRNFSQQPVRPVAKPSLNRLPPAGLDRVVRSTTTNTVDELNGRRVISGPSTIGSTKILSNRPKTRAQAIESEKSATLSKQETHPKPPSWKPKTVPKPPNVKAATTRLGTEGGANPTMLARKRKSDMGKNIPSEKNTNVKRTMITRSSSSKLPQKIFSQSQGQVIIRPTIKLKNNTPAAESTSSTKFMKTSTSTIHSTNNDKVKEKTVSIGKSDKKLPPKLGQPTQPTKPINKPILSKSTTSTKSSTSSSSSNLIKYKSKAIVNPQSKLSSTTTNQKLLIVKKKTTSIGVGPSNKRRKSSLVVGPQVSHRLPCKVSSTT